MKTFQENDKLAICIVSLSVLSVKWGDTLTPQAKWGTLFMTQFVDLMDHG